MQLNNSLDKIDELIKLIDDGLNNDDEEGEEDFAHKILDLIKTDQNAFLAASVIQRAKIATTLFYLNEELRENYYGDNWEILVSTLIKLDPDTFNILYYNEEARDSLYESKAVRMACCRKKIDELIDKGCDGKTVMDMSIALFCFELDLDKLKTLV